jgi:hypothetical protein
MEKSKLIDLLRSFNGREWSNFQLFVQSPYFNRNEAATNLCILLRAHAPSFESLSRTSLFQQLFPGESYNDAMLNHTMSFLLKLAEQFIGQQQFENHAFAGSQYILKGLMERGLEKHYRYKYEKTTQLSGQQTLRDAQYHYEQYFIKNMEANRLSHTSARVFNEYVQDAADHLDYFYLAEKLRCTCYMLTSQVVLASPYNLQLVEEVYRFLQQHPLPESAPSIHAYFYIFQLLRDDHARESFESLKTLLRTQESRFSQQELADLYQYAINYCNFQILKLRPEFVEEALNLYVQGVESGILLEKGKLSPWHYKNIIKLALRLQKFDWTEQFILQNTRLLDDVHRDDAYYYNLAELYYYTGRFDAAMSFLNKVDFSDIHYKLGAKVLLVKIYYETDASDALESLLHSFKTYLNRNKVISEELRRTYLNFIQMVAQMIRATPIQFTALRQKVEQQPLLTDKNWLLQRLS